MIENSQLTTIAVTAVVSVIAKELITWLWALVKTIVVTETIRAKVRAIFTKSNLRIFRDLALVGFYLYVLVSTGWTDSPLTGKDVLVMVAASFFLLMMVIGLLIGLFQAKMAALESKR